MRAALKEMINRHYEREVVLDIRIS
jgi:hypothetical protein